MDYDQHNVNTHATTDYILQYLAIGTTHVTHGRDLSPRENTMFVLSLVARVHPTPDKKSILCT